MPLLNKHLVAPFVLLLSLGTAAALVVPVAVRLKVGITAAPILEPMAKPTPPEIESASPDGTLASFVVNDTGDAADSNIGNGICDTNAAPGTSAPCVRQFRKLMRCSAMTQSRLVCRRVAP